MKIRLHGKKHQSAVPPLNLEEFRNEKVTKYEIEFSNRFDALGTIHEEKTPAELWKNTKTVLLDVANDIIGHVNKKQKKTWITDETLRLIEENRDWKKKDPSKYKQLKTEVQKGLRVDKQRQLDEICDDLEDANKIGDTRRLF